jgi:hypothetical protein
MTFESQKTGSNVALLPRHRRLAGLRLTEVHLRALAEQGSVYQEQHRGNTRYKLRFRGADGRQVVRCVPTNLVEFVRVEMNRLQSNRHAFSALRETTRLIRQGRRDAKRQLQPVLDELGCHFHGTSIRRRRTK